MRKTHLKINCVGNVPKMNQQKADYNAYVLTFELKN